jgi:hypothetical protein
MNIVTLFNKANRNSLEHLEYRDGKNVLGNSMCSGNNYTFVTPVILLRKIFSPVRDSVNNRFFYVPYDLMTIFVCMYVY